MDKNEKEPQTGSKMTDRMKSSSFYTFSCASSNKSFDPSSKQFEALLTKLNQEKIPNKRTKITLRNPKFLRLIKLFKSSINYYETMLLNNESSNLIEFKRLAGLKLIKSDLGSLNRANSLPQAVNQADEFFLCELCGHIVCEPITLACGCTYCKSCLDRFNQAQVQRRNLTMNKKRMSTDQPMTTLFKCKKCGLVNASNTSRFLKTNKCFHSCIEKLFGKHVDLNLLRADLKAYVCLNKFEIEIVLLLFENAFKLDETNHLLLADLFLINYFNETYEKCAEIVEKIIDLVPNWPFAYFMRALCQNDGSLVKKELEHCLQLDSTLDRIQLILQNIEPNGFSNKLDLATKSQVSSAKRHHTISSSNTDTTSSSTSTISHNKSVKLNCLEDQSGHCTNDDSVIDDTIQPYEKQQADSVESSFECVKETSSYMQSSTLTTSSHTVADNNENWDFNDNCIYENCEQQSTSTDCVYPKYPDYSRIETKEQEEDSVQCTEQQNPTSSFELDTPMKIMVPLVMKSKKFDINFDLIKISDVECSLCYRLFYKPVTTTCGHVFCCGCLERSLDHQDRCPLCKSSLSDYLAERRQSITKSIEYLVKYCFFNEYVERERQNQEEVQELIKNQNEIPIFVCTLALPTIHLPLHIFEPRYRLMIRRALSTTGKFGMCMPTEGTDTYYQDSGCLLEIKSVEYLPDGRIIVETVGVRRFRVIERSVKDGYDTARVEWIQDSVPKNDDEKKILHKVKEKVYLMARNWYDKLTADQQDRIVKFFGSNNMSSANFLHEVPDPDNGPKWLWFLISILPIDQEYKLKFLNSNNLLTRLVYIKKVLSDLKDAFDRERALENTQATSSTANNSTDS